MIGNAARVLALALVLLASACALLPVGGRPNSAPAGKPSPVGRGLVEHRAAFHVHCYLSHDSRGRLSEIAQAARSLGIDTVILNDHYRAGNIRRAARGIHHDVLFVPGVELRAGDKSSILSFGLEVDFSRKLSPAERLREAARQGAASARGHVERLANLSLEPFQAFEVYNLHAELVAQSAWSLLWRFLFLPPDAFFEAAVETPEVNLASWDRELVLGRRLAALAGHDAHANVRLFGPLGGTIGTYPEILRLFSNHILATERSVEGIVEAVRAGRTFVVFDYLADGTGFALGYGPRDAPFESLATIGDSAVFDRAHVLRTVIPPVEAESIRARVVLDGRCEAVVEGTRDVCVPLSAGGAARVEVYLGNRLWIISSPIYITRTRADRS